MKIAIKNTKEIRSNLWMLLVFLMFGFPVFLQGVKIALLVLLVMLTLTAFLKNVEQRNNGITIISMFFWLVYMVVGVIGGILNRTPGLGAFLKINGVYYPLFFYLTFGLNEERDFYQTIKGIYYANYVIIVYSIYLLLYGYGLFHGMPMIELDNAANVGMHVGYTHITNTNLSMTILTFPMLFLSMRDIISKSIIRSSKLFINLFLTASVMVLSGRRILWIVVAFSLFAMFIIKELSRKKKVRYFMLMLVTGIVVLLVAQSIFKITIKGYIERWLSAFSKTDEYGLENVRLRQGRELIQAFLRNPIFGAGAGAYVPGYVRSNETPWTYEMTYHVMLFTTGIVGTLAFGMSVLCILYSIYNTNREFKNGVLFSFLMALFATSTNPYIGASFDFLLFLFIPIQYVNCYRKNKHDISYGRELGQRFDGMENRIQEFN